MFWNTEGHVRAGATRPINIAHIGSRQTGERFHVACRGFDRSSKERLNLPAGIRATSAGPTIHCCGTFVGSTRPIPDRRKCPSPPLATAGWFTRRQKSVALGHFYSRREQHHIPAQVVDVEIGRHDVGIAEQGNCQLPLKQVRRLVAHPSKPTKPAFNRE
jgi:hypothetical protein